MPNLHNVPFDFALPRQSDGYSCGIIALNLLAVLFLHEDVWSQCIADAERMEWFIRLSDDYNDSAVAEVCF